MTTKTAKANVVPVRQRTQYSCMAASMTMCLKALGYDLLDEDQVNRVMGAAPMQGAAWEQALATAQHFGCRATLTMPATVEQLKAWTDAGVPVMIAWNPEGRPWSHASVVFDVDADLNVYVADPNIPNPKETVRIVPEAEFYGKWYEKFPDYLVRRPACAIEREITTDGKQVRLASADKTGASAYKFNGQTYTWKRVAQQRFYDPEFRAWNLVSPQMDILATLKHTKDMPPYAQKEGPSEWVVSVRIPATPEERDQHGTSKTITLKQRFPSDDGVKNTAEAQAFAIRGFEQFIKGREHLKTAEMPLRDNTTLREHQLRWDNVTTAFSKTLAASISVPKLDVKDRDHSVEINIGPLFGIRYLGLHFQINGSTVPNAKMPPSFSVVAFPSFVGRQDWPNIPVKAIERDLFGITMKMMTHVLSPFGKTNTFAGGSAAPGHGVIVHITDDLEAAWANLPAKAALLGHAISKMITSHVGDFRKNKAQTTQDLQQQLDDARQQFQYMTEALADAKSSGDTDSERYYDVRENEAKLRMDRLKEQLEGMSKVAFKPWTDPHKSPAGVPYPKSKWDHLGKASPFRWSTPAENHDGSYPEPWRVTDKDAALVLMKHTFPHFKDIYTDYESTQHQGHNLILVGLRDNRDKVAHQARIAEMVKALHSHWPVLPHPHGGALWLMDDVKKDVLRHGKHAKGPQTTVKTQDEKRREQNKITVEKATPRNDAARALAERGNKGQGTHKNKQDFDRGHARSPKHKKNFDREAVDRVTERFIRASAVFELPWKFRGEPSLASPPAAIFMPGAGGYNLHVVPPGPAKAAIEQVQKSPLYPASTIKLDGASKEFPGADVWAVMMHNPIAATLTIEIVKALKQLGYHMNVHPKIQRQYGSRFIRGAYSGNPDGKPIYDVKIDHGENQALSGGHDVMKRLQDQYRIEQGHAPREPNPRLASDVEWVMDKPFHGRVNDAFLDRIRSHSDLRHVLGKAGSKGFVLSLPDYFDDPEFNGGSEYDVYFQPAEPGWWTIIVGMTHGGALIKTLGDLLRVRPMRSASGPKQAWLFSHKPVPTVQEAPEWIVPSSGPGKVNDAFLDRIKAHPQLKHFINTEGHVYVLMMGGLIMGDPENESSTDVQFQPAKPGWWAMHINPIYSKRIINRLSDLLKIPVKTAGARWNANTPGEVEHIEHLTRRFVAVHGRGT